MCLQASATAAAGPIRPLPRHQLAVPAQNGVGRHDRRDLCEQAPTKAVTQFGQAPPLVVFEPQALPRKPILQHAILFTKERDQVGLLTVQPVTESRDQQLKRKHAPSLRYCHRSTCGTLRASPKS
jgi:hypothetical protein